MASDTAPLDLDKRIASAIFDPGATEGFKGDRTLTEWQTAAVIRALSATRTAVKPLDWEDYTKGPGCPLRYLALLPFGRLMIFQWGAPDYWCFSWDGHGGKFAGNSLEEAKATAQVDYERRIRSTLAPPSSLATGDAKEIADRLREFNGTPMDARRLMIDAAMMVEYQATRTRAYGPYGDEHPADGVTS